MSDEVFTDPGEGIDDGNDDRGSDEWVDVRMTNPDEGEWDVDAVVVNGRVEYVDLRIRAELLAGFVSCLTDDVGAERGGEILAEIARRQGLDLVEHVDEE